MDRVLDRASSGPLFLRIPEIAEMVASEVREGEERRRYQLHSYVIMPNHLHLLVTSCAPMSQWLRVLKGITAHQANRILARAGQPFWQDESYDHLVRSAIEFGRIQDYIECNPVKAGLVASVELWPWSSAGQSASGRCTGKTAGTQAGLPAPRTQPANLRAARRK